MSELVDACQNEPAGKRLITIPEFQRRLVWTKDKQEKLVTSIKQGYPVGSLLLYEDMRSGMQGDNMKRRYKLVDGLQRTQALNRYMRETTKFFSRDDIPEEIITAIQRVMNVYKTVTNEEIVATILKWVHSLNGFTEVDGWGVDGLISHLIGMLDFDLDSDDYMRAYMKISTNGVLKDYLAQFLKGVRESSDISEAKLPVIIYNGPAAELPTVFELLNSQGTVLSRYEIYAAQWIDERQKIKNEAIINAIWRKYDALEDEGFTLDVAQEAPDQRARKQREYSLFEYLFGLGQHLSDKYRYLFKSVNPDRPNSAGFNLVAACIGLSVKEMDKLPDHLRGLDRDDLEEKILESVKFVQDVLAPILSVKQKNGRMSVYHSEYQIISMIATAFRACFDTKKHLSEREGWRNALKTLERNLPMFYLYDILRDWWRGTGDTKLGESVSQFRYLGDPPRWESWEAVLDGWFLDNQAALRHNRRYVRDATPEILLLKYIYVHKLTVADNAKEYHIEHVIPVDQLVNVMAHDERWPINAVGNLALLKAEDNLKKGNRTYKQYWDEVLASGKITEREHEHAIQVMADQLICPVGYLPDSLNWDRFGDFLIDRFSLLKQVFRQVWEDAIPLPKEQA